MSRKGRTRRPVDGTARRSIGATREHGESSRRIGRSLSLKASMRKVFVGRRPSRLLSALAFLGFAAALAVTAAHPAIAQDLPTGRFAGPRGFVLTIGNDGTWSVGVASGVVQVSGKYRVTSGQLELTDNPGPRACAAGTGRYTWLYGADTLRFSVVDDPCTGRRAVFASTWTLLREALALTHATNRDGTGARRRAGMA